MKSDGQRALDQWANEVGYANFEVYLQLGGSLTAARADFERRAGKIVVALMALTAYGLPPATASSDRSEDADMTPRALILEHPEPVVGPEALARLEAEQCGEDYLDVHNAHPQGEDYAC